MVKLSLVIPCYNEARTLEPCVDAVLAIRDESLDLEIIIVDDASTDGSSAAAERLAQRVPGLVVLRHGKNRGKGAALRTGFARATGDFVAVQDADLEYDPQDLRRLLIPLRKGEADVVVGSRFQAQGYHRVLYFWHYLGNNALTLLSNMLTDLNLTDMETCYKVFRREVIQAIRLEEDRFGFEPEVIAKVAQMRLRIYETGISYRGRTYAEGKKIGIKDGFRAVYCVLKYNLPRAPLPIQFLAYSVIGGFAALLNLALFLWLMASGAAVTAAAPAAFTVAAALNYYLSIKTVFRHRARWSPLVETVVLLLLVAGVGAVDLFVTASLLERGWSPLGARCAAILIGWGLNFPGRRFLVFPEPSNPAWKPQQPSV